MLRDNDAGDEDLSRVLTVQLCFTYNDSPPYHRHYRVIDMLGHISERENELETIAFISVFLNTNVLALSALRNPFA